MAQLQDEEVGDGTTSVVIVAAELLKNADELVKQKIHPTSIMAGYRLACKEAVKYIQVRNMYMFVDLVTRYVFQIPHNNLSGMLESFLSDFHF